MFQEIKNFFSSVSKTIFTFLLSIVLISTIQWILIQFMATYCAPYSIMGPIYNLINLGSPVCYFINRVQLSLSEYYITLWASTGLAVIAWFTSIKIFKTNE